ncbi:MAG TPA: MFS transporter [Casimicrobiaceae bacterium]|nr:MFS transporter [Casimicrobiaceae bacterium]
MTGPARPGLSPLRFLIILGIANHMVLAGSRVAVSLDALALGASTAVVGALMALYAVLPALLAISAGRFADRFGVRKPMLTGSCGLFLAGLLALAMPGLPTLFATTTLIGVSFMIFQVANQYATGELGGPEARVRNFGYLALGYSTSSIAGPLMAGFLIDHAGFRTTFAALAILPLIPIGLLASDRLRLPGPHPAHDARATTSALDLMQHPDMRRAFAINALLTMAWEVHTMFVPIYGNGIGLSASRIGLILAAFATATFLVRLATPLIIQRVSEQQVLTIALFVGGAVYLAFPFMRNTGTLMALSFTLGLGLGIGQPMVMAILHANAPPGRMGEATGLRMSLINSMSVAVPLLFGAAGGTIGLAPVLWSVGVFLTTGGWLTRKHA